MKQNFAFLIFSLFFSFTIYTSLAQSNPVKPTVKTGNTLKSSQRNFPKKYSTYRRDTIKNTDFSLNGQYQFMLSRSKTINGYKLINPGRLAGVWQSALDSLKKERNELKTAVAKLEEQKKALSNLEGELSGKEDILNSSNAKINEITFLGISLSKGVYHTIVWSIIGVLALGLVIVIARSAKSVLEAKHRTQLYEEISAEYLAFKSKSNEQQRKLARELQDERNKIEEMKSR